MDKFPCHGKLLIHGKPNPWKKEWYITSITFNHDVCHVQYLDVGMPPAALKYIKSQRNATPGLIASQLAAQYPHITQAQVYSAWSRQSEAFWKKDEDPLVSAQMLLREAKDEADFWELEVPDGVTAIAWGCRQISRRIGATTVEIGLDATCEYSLVLIDCY